jgi:hypothetical protein
MMEVVQYINIFSPQAYFMHMPFHQNLTTYFGALGLVLFAQPFSPSSVSYSSNDSTLFFYIIPFPNNTARAWVGSSELLSINVFELYYF